MMTVTAKNILWTSFVAVGLAVGLAISLVPLEAQRGAGSPVTIDPDDIGGVVTSAKGPEAGVWVIAETKDLPTGYRKIVVTDDQGRYLVPDLPKGTYRVWVRGYGLLDSRPLQATPGQVLNLSAVVAPNAQVAAAIYPANYWWSLIEVPPKSAFPLQEDGVRFQSQADWIQMMKGGTAFIQLGDKATREVPEKLGGFKSSVDAWEAWLNSPDSPTNVGGGIRTKRGVKMYAAWTDRIAAGAVPPAPPRPIGVERNVVITQWDWADAKGFVHDEIATDKRNPTLNANGPIYGPEQFSADVVDVLDPVRHTTSRITVPIGDPNQPLNAVTPQENLATAPLVWGKEIVRPAKANLHNPMLDHKGRLWLTGAVRHPDTQPAFCKEGSSHPAAKLFPLSKNASSGGGRQLMVYDPKTKEVTFVDTCYGTHHLQFAEDANHTLWTSGGGDVIGYLNTKLFDETGDLAKAQGWCPVVLDTNGNGKLDPGWTEPPSTRPGQASLAESIVVAGGKLRVDPTKDTRVRGGGYGIIPNPLDGSVWIANPGVPGSITRLNPGPNPPATCLAERYNPPAGVFSPKGIDVDRSTGLLWVGFGGSGHFASFDRRKCTVLNGPDATGDHCPEGWTVYPAPGPRFQGVTDDITADFPYTNWVDQFDILGLGKNVPLAPGTNSDSILALVPETKQWVTLRVPYPLGFFARGLDGRIDDPQGGWKGKGLWSAYASISPWHYEGGKGATSKVVKVQLRPDPLAR